MKNLLNYIRGFRKGKEAHRLEKESMKDPFLADAMDGYSQIEGNHELQIDKLRMKVRTRSSKKKNPHAVTWSIAACLAISIGISSYFLFLKKSMTEEVFIALEDIPATIPEPAAPKKNASSLSETKTRQDSTTGIKAKHISPKDMIAKGKAVARPAGASAAMSPDTEEATVEKTAADKDTSLLATRRIKMLRAAIPAPNLIKGKVTNEKGEPIVGACITYTGTNIGTITNLNGEFSLAREEGNKQLTAQFIGYQPVEMPVDTSRVMLIAMNEDKQTFNETVVVGYGNNKRTKEKEQVPQPVIGKRKYKNYLKENLVRPNDGCREAKGEVVLAFFVNEEGTPQNITVVHSLCDSADKEAIRLLKEGPKWTPGNLPARISVQF